MALDFFKDLKNVDISKTIDSISDIASSIIGTSESKEENSKDSKTTA